PKVERHYSQESGTIDIDLLELFRSDSTFFITFDIDPIQGIDFDRSTGKITVDSEELRLQGHEPVALRLVATDGVERATQTITVTLNNDPMLNEYTASIQPTLTANAAIYNAWEHFRDDDNDQLIYSLTDASEHLAALEGGFQASAGVFVLPNSIAPNNYTVTVEATDGYGITATATITIDNPYQLENNDYKPPSELSLLETNAVDGFSIGDLVHYSSEGTTFSVSAVASYGNGQYQRAVENIRYNPETGVVEAPDLLESPGTYSITVGVVQPGGVTLPETEYVLTITGSAFVDNDNDGIKITQSDNTLDLTIADLFRDDDAFTIVLDESTELPRGITFDEDQLQFVVDPQSIYPTNRGTQPELVATFDLVIDGYNTGISNSVTLTPNNDPVALSSQININIANTQPLSIAAGHYLIDPNNDTLSYLVVASDSTGLTFDATTGMLNVTAARSNETHTYRVLATDGFGGSQGFTDFVVTYSNQGLRIDETALDNVQLADVARDGGLDIGNILAIPDSSVTYTVTGTRWNNGNAPAGGFATTHTTLTGLTYDSTSGLITSQNAQDAITSAPGIYAFSITATIGAEEQIAINFVTITGDVFAPITNSTLRQTGDIVPIPVDTLFLDESPITLALSEQTTRTLPAGISLFANDLFEGTHATPYLSIDLDVLKAGDLGPNRQITITLAAIDNDQQLLAEQILTVTLSTAPFASAEALQEKVLTTSPNFSVDLTTVVFDAESDSITFSLSDDAPSWVSLAVSGDELVPNGDPSTIADGVYIVDVIAFDSFQTQSVLPFTFTFSPLNATEATFQGLTTAQVAMDGGISVGDLAPNLSRPQINVSGIVQFAGKDDQYTLTDIGYDGTHLTGTDWQTYGGTYTVTLDLITPLETYPSEVFTFTVSGDLMPAASDRLTDTFAQSGEYVTINPADLFHDEEQATIGFGARLYQGLEVVSGTLIEVDNTALGAFRHDNNNLSTEDYLAAASPYILEVQAIQNGVNLGVSKSITLTLNNAPTAEESTFSIDVAFEDNFALTINEMFSDIDGDHLTYSIVSHQAFGGKTPQPMMTPPS
nr:hypothetical protein [Alphaproteobacteria bacterium]